MDAAVVAALRPHYCSVVAHRGFSAAFPENTLTSLRESERLGADAIEVDVRLTRDGVPMLLHDAALNRTVRNGSGALAHKTWEDVARLDAGDGRAPPSLRTAIDKTSVPLILDVKESTPDAMRRIVETVGAAHHRCWFQSDCWDTLGQAPVDRRMILLEAPPWRHRLRRPPTSARRPERSVTRVLRNWAERSASTPYAVNVQFGAWQPHAHETLLRVGKREFGLQYAATWTLNTRDDVEAAARSGYDAIVSDRPEAVQWRNTALVSPVTAA